MLAIFQSDPRRPSPLMRKLDKRPHRRVEAVQTLGTPDGVQFGGTRGHALGVAVGYRIDAGRQQLAGLIGRGTGPGEAEDARTADPLTPSRLSIL